MGLGSGPGMPSRAGNQEGRTGGQESLGVDLPFSGVQGLYLSDESKLGCGRVGYAAPHAPTGLILRRAREGLEGMGRVGHSHVMSLPRPWRLAWLHRVPVPVSRQNARRQPCSQCKT